MPPPAIAEVADRAMRRSDRAARLLQAWHMSNIRWHHLHELILVLAAEGWKTMGQEVS